MSIFGRLPMSIFLVASAALIAFLPGCGQSRFLPELSRLSSGTWTLQSTAGDIDATGLDCLDTFRFELADGDLPDEAPEGCVAAATITWCDREAVPVWVVEVLQTKRKTLTRAGQEAPPPLVGMTCTVQLTGTDGKPGCWGLTFYEAGGEAGGAPLAEVDFVATPPGDIEAPLNPFEGVAVVLPPARRATFSRDR